MREPVDSEMTIDPAFKERKTVSLWENSIGERDPKFRWRGEERQPCVRATNFHTAPTQVRGLTGNP